MRGRGISCWRAAGRLRNAEVFDPERERQSWPRGDVGHYRGAVTKRRALVRRFDFATALRLIAFHGRPLFPAEGRTRDPGFAIQGSSSTSILSANVVSAARTSSLRSTGYWITACPVERRLRLGLRAAARSRLRA